MHPTFLATFLLDGCNANIAHEGLSRRKTIAFCSKSDEETGSQIRPCPWQARE
jgi:hypothetical protein